MKTLKNQKDMSSFNYQTQNEVFTRRNLYGVVLGGRREGDEQPKSSTGRRWSGWPVKKQIPISDSTHLWLLNPSITGIAVQTLPAGKPLTRRYRVVVHDGDTPTTLLQKLSAEWAEWRGGK
jgi:hypothetical protein